MIVALLALLLPLLASSRTPGAHSANVVLQPAISAASAEDSFLQHDAQCAHHLVEIERLREENEEVERLREENKQIDELREQVHRLTIQASSSSPVHALSVCPPCPPSMPCSTSTAKEAVSDTCFTATTGGRTVAMLPISRLPATHPAIAKETCGTKLTTDDPIPARSIARWKKLPGQTRWATTSESCKNKKLRKAKYYEQTAPQLFYAYGYPVASTGNPGYYSPDTASLYPIVDAEQVRVAVPQKSPPAL